MFILKIKLLTCNNNFNTCNVVMFMTVWNGDVEIILKVYIHDIPT